MTAFSADAAGKPIKRPVRKVTAGGIAGALSALLVYALNSYALPSNKQIPAEIASAITTVITFIVSYWIPPGGDESSVSTP